MRKNFGPKSVIYPMPVLIVAAYNEDGTPNAMNAAWGGMADTNLIGVCLSEDHQTTQDILARKAFTVSFATAEQVVAADYVGIVSGKEVPDKVARAGWHTEKSAFVDAPLIGELPLALECEFVSYDIETGLLLGRIVNVSADEAILNEQGRVDLSLYHPITYDPMNHDYVALGETVGKAYSDGKRLK